MRRASCEASATLLERQAAFLETFRLLEHELRLFQDPEIVPAIIRASAMLVVGATLDQPASMTMTSAREMREEDEEDE